MFHSEPDGGRMGSSGSIVGMASPSSLRLDLRLAITSSAVGCLSCGFDCRINSGAPSSHTLVLLAGHTSPLPSNGHQATSGSLPHPRMQGCVLSNLPRALHLARSALYISSFSFSSIVKRGMARYSRTCGEFSG